MDTTNRNAETPLVGVIMGSKSDWETMGRTSEALTKLDIPHECRVVSAHRTPDLMAQYAKEAASRGLEVIIAAAGGAAHLPGMVAAHTSLPADAALQNLRPVSHRVRAQGQRVLPLLECRVPYDIGA